MHDARDAAAVSIAPMIQPVQDLCKDRDGGVASMATMSVLDVIAAWPDDLPIAAVVSADEGSPWSRWSVLAAPQETITSLHAASDALSARRADPAESGRGELPFHQGWIGWLNYDAGRQLEPRACHSTGARDDRGWPDVCLHRCEGAYVYDHHRGVWHVAGDAASLPPIEPLDHKSTLAEVNAMGPIEYSLDQAAYESIVQRAIEYIHAGDVFQVNLARRMSMGIEGSSRALFRALVSYIAPWYGALIDGPEPGSAVLSTSPELLVAGSRRSGGIVTRPIKGTAPGSASEDLLATSAKDQAELAMIVDLMRNDLGRVCRPGSVRVRDARSIERHGAPGSRGVQHGVATVAGALREGCGLWDVIQGVFPAGSITGAPKIRAMQIIDELEPVRRGPYCGSVIMADDGGAFHMNVGIRTSAVRGESMDGSWARIRGDLDYFVGAGIVADSDPHAEWRETCAKAAGFEYVMRQLSPTPVAEAAP